MDDVRAVMDAAGSDRAALIGSADGAAMAALFAATYPDRTAALILNNPLVRGRWAADYPWGSQDDPDSPGSFADGWGGRQAIEEEIAEDMPGRVGDEEFNGDAGLQTPLRQPDHLREAVELTLEIDVREALPMIRAPTLVTHIDRTDPQAKAPEDLVPSSDKASRYVAERVAGSRLVDWRLGSHGMGARPARVPCTFREFLTGAWEAGAWEPAEPDRMLTTLLFTDIVKSTSAQQSSEMRAGATRPAPPCTVRQELVRFRGREIDTAGDGFFASFDGPARALRCASAVMDAVPELGLDRGPASIPVNASSSTRSWEASRCSSGHVSSTAPPGQVLASSTVKDLVAGSGITFETVASTSSRAFPARGASRGRRRTSAQLAQGTFPHARAGHNPHSLEHRSRRRSPLAGH